MKILAIESSCDETSAAVIENKQVLSNIISSQHFHTKFGGVVPELASRAHIRSVALIVKDALKAANTGIDDISALAVTSEPGLIGSLIVGSNYAKGLSIRYGLPLVPVNHIEGHLYSGCLQDPELDFPFTALVVSGGHTIIFNVLNFDEYSIMGLTRDDAAGEAFDKVAKLLGLGYPGGPQIDKLAKQGSPTAYDFPRSMINSPDYDFSFSGLKTSVRYFIHKEFPGGVPEEKIPDMCASVQAAIIDVLVSKTLKAALSTGSNAIVIAGGVSANSGLRALMTEKAGKEGIKVITPDMKYCVDNAAMIGYIAERKLESLGPDRFRGLTFRVNATALRAPKRKRKKS
ncbi:MAG: tRNA (adenosine(37)-N6)-threonylcarbamoyltransferase complex transferase subunit TsaD [Candidatus Kapaibacterium sp.]